MSSRVLAVDPHPLLGRQLVGILEPLGLEVASEADVAAAVERLRDDSFSLVVTDWSGPGIDGAGLLATIRRERRPVGVVILSGSEDAALAIEAMKAGADDYVTRPLNPERFRLIVRRILERRALIDELEQLRHRMRADHGFQNLVSKNARMRKVFDLIERIGPLASTVLINGETGTGKDLAAQAIHGVSGRRGPWIAVNCAALQETLLESELFGHERGAFTGADHRRLGRFEMADGGTLFLDEVAEISPGVQAKLLRVLQTGQFERLGGEQTIQDARIIAASNRRLEDEVAAGRFRSDLFYRLSVIRIDLPPLRERREDIPLLAAHFLERLKTKSTPPVTEIHPEAMQALLDHPWPGNVRELENSIKAAVAMAEGSILSREALPSSVAPRTARRAGHKPLIDIERTLPDVTTELVARVEREYFAQLLARYRGNIARCARHSQLSRRCVAIKLQKYALNHEEFKLSASQERIGN